MSAPTLAIVNPASGSGATGRRWSQIEARLREILGGFDTALTSGHRDAERIARKAVDDGIRRLLVAGGDGTTSEVVSGLLQTDAAAAVELGLLPLGRGGDLARHLHIPRDLDAAIAALASSEVRKMDAAAIRFRDESGRECSTHFVNVASFGLSGLVDRAVRAFPVQLGGTLAYLLASLAALTRYRALPVRVRVDGELVHEGPVMLVAVANGAYFGGGMHIAPGARCDDGELDVVVIGDLSGLSAVRHLPSLYSGRHLALPFVSQHRARTVEVEPCRAGDTLWMDVDGDALGLAPARIEVRPAALTIAGRLVPGARA